MPDRHEQLAALRRLLAERCPPTPRRPDAVVPTGIAAVDRLLQGGLRRGSITEIVVAARSGGGQLLLDALIEAADEARHRLLLIDATDAFDFEPAAGASCPTLDAVWRAADLGVRDAHFTVVVVDIRGVATRELRRTPPGVWYRLQRAAGESGVAAVVQSDVVTVPCAQARLLLNRSFTLDALAAERTELRQNLGIELQRQRLNQAEEVAG
jgi:hypothetical protein